MPDFYGPLWQWLSGATHALAGEDLLANLLAYKLLGAVAVGTSGWLIYAILTRAAPRFATAGLALWLWNPVVLNEGVMQGHDLGAVTGPRGVAGTSALTGVPAGLQVWRPRWLQSQRTAIHQP